MTQALDKPEEELDVIDEKTAECYKCGKIGHFARSYRHPPKSRSSIAGRKPTRRTRFGRSSLYQLEQEDGDSESDEESELESDEEEERDSYYYDGDYVDENHTADGIEYLNLIATYELNTDMVSVVDSDSDNDMEHVLTGDLVASSALLLYDADINGADAKLVIDSGATTQFIDEATAHAIKAQIIVIPPHCVKVAGKGQVACKMVNRVAVLDVKLSDVPIERIYAYVIALDDQISSLGVVGCANTTPSWTDARIYARLFEMDDTIRSTHRNQSHISRSKQMKFIHCITWITYRRWTINC